MEITSQDEKVLRKFPFLRDFPFPEFSIATQAINAGWINGSIVPLDGSFEMNIFTCFEEKLNRKTNVSVYDHELEWLAKIADKITNLDKINDIIGEALESTDLIVKRDFMRNCLEWLIKLNDGKATLSFTIFSDVMIGLMDHFGVKDPAKFITTINKLSESRGILFLSPEEYNTLMAFYDFHFIYTKLMLGVIIASKLSV